MRPGEIVELEVERYGGNMVLDLAAESVGQPCVAPQVHPHGQVLALHEGRADMPWIRIADDHVPLGPDAGGGRVPFLILGRVGTVELLENCVVDLSLKCSVDGHDVGLVAVRGQLHPSI